MKIAGSLIAITLAIGVMFNAALLAHVTKAADYWLPIPGLLVRVVDGDTIAVGPQRLRIFGIDAPELEQSCTDGRGAAYPCGVLAKQAMTDLIAGTDLKCRTVDRDRYGRPVVICVTQPITLADLDIGAVMVQKGWALDYTTYSHGAYRTEQETAKAAKLGIWMGSFELPWEWREEHR